MRSSAIVLTLILAAGLPSIAPAADAPGPTTLDLWPGPAPGEEGKIGEEKTEKARDGEAIRSITNVTKPTLKVYRPAEDQDTHVAIVVCPGGGYNMLAWDHEGEQVARWLNSLGVTAAVLKYRVPRRPGTPRGEPPKQALMDAQRALSIVRGKADDWGIDPKRVGILGFSAGGHLSAWASTNSETRAYEPVDATDKVSCRPDFAVVIYPGGVVKRGSDQLASEIRINSETPPMFIAQSHDDPVNPENAVRLYLALKHAGVPAELHIYSTGGHGYGLRPTGKPSATWPARCAEWLQDRGLLKSNAAKVAP
jgi:acetyl esterase/lipase